MNEGWFHDPFEVHQLRWFSAGTPTDLVRDDDVEAYEAPPADRWDGALVAHRAYRYGVVIVGHGACADGDGVVATGRGSRAHRRTVIT